MPGNTIGSALKITTWGESHGKGVGVVIDGLVPVDVQDEVHTALEIEAQDYLRYLLYPKGREYAGEGSRGEK